MNIDWYYTFLAVAKYQNYRKAAEELFSTQTTVFNHIKNLETLLNAKLFKQSGRNIILTEIGYKFLPLAKETLLVYEKNIKKIKEYSSTKPINLKIVISSYIDNYLLPKFLPLFLKQEPHINLSINVSDNSFDEALINGKYDIGIDRKPPKNIKLHYKNIGEDKIQLTVPDIKENKKLLTEIDYFKKYTIFSYNHPLYWKKLEADIYNIYPEAKFVSISSVRSTEDLIAANQGISYLPTYIVSQLHHSQIKLIAPHDIHAPISHTYLMWKTLSPIIEIFNSAFEKFINYEKTSIY